MSETSYTLGATNSLELQEALETHQALAGHLLCRSLELSLEDNAAEELAYIDEVLTETAQKITAITRTLEAHPSSRAIPIPIDYLLDHAKDHYGPSYQILDSPLLEASLPWWIAEK